MPSGESFSRSWLAYSTSKDVVFCFCCKIFKTSAEPNNFIDNGVNTWKSLSEKIKSHENSVNHLTCYRIWLGTEIRFNEGNTIDDQQQKIIEKESLHWRNVLTRLMNVVLFLAKNKL